MQRCGLRKRCGLCFCTFFIIYYVFQSSITFSVKYIHSRTSNADMHGLAESKQHASLFLRLQMVLGALGFAVCCCLLAVWAARFLQHALYLHSITAPHTTLLLRCLGRTDSIPGPSCTYSVAIPTELLGPRSVGYVFYIGPLKSYKNYFQRAKICIKMEDEKRQH
jgi:hypothetical protein